MSKKHNSKMREAIIRAIEEEPELPDDPPSIIPELWNDDALSLLRTTVRLTKQNILARVRKAM